MAFPARADATAIERAARLCGIAGLCAPVLLAIWLYAIPANHIWRAGTITLLVSYCAVMLSFLGGIRFGAAIAGRQGNARDLTLAILAPTIGWASVMTPLPYAFAMLAAAFAAQGASDAIASHLGKVPDWYGRLRQPLTLIVVAAMILAFVATA